VECGGGKYPPLLNGLEKQRLEAQGQKNSSTPRLLMIKRANLIRPVSKLQPLIEENDELISIFVSSIKTSKQKEKKTS
jgi:hypothetical protein